MVIRSVILGLVGLVLLSGCASGPPDQVHDACLILQDNRSWWRDLQRTERRWGISPGTQLAFLKKESSFNRHARPARRRLLGVIPGARPSSAYGCAQALNSTWDWYREDTGRRGADRDDFGDARKERLRADLVSACADAEARIVLHGLSPGSHKP